MTKISISFQELSIKQLSKRKKKSAHFWCVRFICYWVSLVDVIWTQIRFLFFVMRFLYFTRRTNFDFFFAFLTRKLRFSFSTLHSQLQRTFISNAFFYVWNFGQTHAVIRSDFPKNRYWVQMFRNRYHLRVQSISHDYFRHSTGGCGRNSHCVARNGISFPNSVEAHGQLIESTQNEFFGHFECVFNHSKWSKSRRMSSL